MIEVLDSSFVTISLQRYEELIKLETRVNVIIERLAHSVLFDKEDILRVLDTESSIKAVQKLRAEYEKRRKECTMQNME